MSEVGGEAGRLVAMMILLLAATSTLLGLTACGGGGGSSGFFGQKVQNYRVTVTATSGPLSHNTAVTLVVE